MAQHPTDSKQIIIEIGHASATISNGNERSTVSLVRGSDGRLSEAGRAALKTSIHEAASSTGGDAAVKATCAIAARGVSLRTIQIPRSNQANLRQILSLQIEKEFPLSPDKLAWGHNIIDDNPSSSNRTILLAAVKRTVLEDYQEIFKELGIEARFTPTALATIEAAPETPWHVRDSECRPIAIGTPGHRGRSSDIASNVGHRIGRRLRFPGGTPVRRRFRRQPADHRHRFGIQRAYRKEPGHWNFLPPSLQQSPVARCQRWMYSNRFRAMEKTTAFSPSNLKLARRARRAGSQSSRCDGSRPWPRCS